MSEPGSQSTLYRLIEAGLLARRALAAPLAAHGLEVGDDAVLFLLHTSGGATVEELTTGLGLGPDGLDARLFRMLAQGLIVRRAVGPDAVAGLALTDAGETLHAALADHWAALEASLTEGLPKKSRKRLKHALTQFIDQLG